MIRPGSGWRFAVCLSLALLLASFAFANEMVVDTRTLRMNDLATITISLEGSFASSDYVDVPLQNLDFVGEPSMGSEYTWINGTITRRKVFRYRVRPIAPGPARIGPVELTDEDGHVQRLAAVAIEVLPDQASTSNDAQMVLRELLATDRDPFFVVAEADKQALYVGEAVTITWVMYNAAAVQQWQVINIPKLTDFWSEELTRNETPERLYLGDVMVQRLPVRRVVLFPLRSGRLRVDGMTVEADIMRRTRRGPFSMFEGELVEDSFTSAPVELDVKPLPPGPRADAVGQLALTCDPPIQRGAGPVLVRFALSGLGNVRAAIPPRFERSVDGTVQLEGGQVTITGDEGPARLTRRWQYLILPARTGTLAIPALAMNIFDPGAGLHRQLRCPAVTLDVVAVSKPVPASDAPSEEGSRPIPWPWWLGGGALLLALGLAVPRLLREAEVRREALRIVRGATPAEVRARMEQRVAIDLREPTDRGDAWRALRSLLEATERDRDIGANSEKELVRRVREVLRLTRR
ncbi:MAG: BatD family protein [Acidobacteriota bacterium]